MSRRNYCYKNYTLIGIISDMNLNLFDDLNEKQPQEIIATNAVILIAMHIVLFMLLR